MSTTVSIDPFSDDIVKEPRAIEQPVESLNREALDRLVQAFERTESKGTRATQAPSVQLVLSPEPGYGKSHLIGRLFRRLDQKATLIYLRPFQDPASCWIQLLHKLVRELDMPNRGDTLVLGPQDQTQLTVLTRKVLEQLAGRLIVDGLLPPAQVPVGATNEEHTLVWKTWMSQHFEKLLVSLDRLLQAEGLRIQPSRTAWLRVLYAYAFMDDVPNARAICLDWLQMQPIEATEGQLLGLRRAELPQEDLPHAARNEACFERLQALLQLASFYRPFLFCFDQTELYGNPALARTFGIVLSRLNRECANHLAIATANQNVWEKQVAWHFEIADRHVVDTSPVVLEGMNRAQADELLQGRLQQAPKPWPTDFPDTWLDDLFIDRRQIPVREFLQRASIRWNGGAAVPAENEVERLFLSCRDRLVARRSQLTFDPGVFQWNVEHVISPAANAEAKAMKSDRGYLTLCWDCEVDRCYFGFEAGRAWKRWDAMIAEAKRYIENDEHRLRTSRVAFWRTPDQPALAQRNRDAIAKLSGKVMLLTPNRFQTADLFAGHDLYADAEAGDRRLDPKRVLAFLRERIGPTWVRAIRQIHESEDDTIKRPTPLSPKDVAAVIEKKKMASIELVMTELSTRFADIERDRVVEAAGQIPQIKVWISPKATVFQWLP